MRFPKDDVLPTRLRTRMILLIDVAQSGHIDVGVDLGRCDAFVPEKLLNLAEVGAAFE